MVQKEKRQGGGKRAWTEGDIRWCRRRKDREGARGHGLRVT